MSTVAPYRMPLRGAGIINPLAFGLYRTEELGYGELYFL